MTTTTNDLLLQLQSVDTTADQLAHRRRTLAERDAATAAQQALADWRRRGDELRRRITELGEQIEREEAESAQIDQHRARLQAQLRTVIAPREAEALQHEIAVLEQRRAGLDDDELAALEDQAALDDELTTITADGPTLEQAVGDTAAALAAAEAAIDAELAELATTRDAVRGQIDATLIARYDRLRSQLGVAVARLVGNRCDGCHLDLSAAEAEQVRAVPADQAADCPNCGRLLIR
jgi:predicted  nucleic acid-binding Zn-ribbon protein